MTDTFEAAAAPGTPSGPEAPDDRGATPRRRPAEQADDDGPESEAGEEDPGAAADQPPVEPIYPPGTHGH